jgi:predicted CXXCH cytochrome family protein
MHKPQVQLPRHPTAALAVRLTLLLSLAVVVLAPAHSALAQDAPPNKAPNPHWKSESCESCHTYTAGRVTPVPRQRIEQLCVTCHDGDRAGDEAHPVGRGFADDAEGVRRPDWPLVANQVTCITCHDVKLQCEPSVQRPRTNAAFLRDRQHAAADQPFCANCHVPDAYPKYNPHAMLVPGAADAIDQQKCLFCHDRVPDRNQTQRTGDPQLRQGELQICTSCHRQHLDPYSRGHIGTRVGEDMRAYMRAREVLGLTSSPSPQLLEQIKAQKIAPTRMALDREGRINCSTCHNPHEHGTFPLTSPLAYRGIRIAEGKTLSPVRGEQWCRHCHDY